MRILQVMAGAERGGAETAFVDMCLALHEAGEAVEAVTRPNDLRVPKLQEAGITVHTLPFGGRLDVFTRWRLGKIIKTFRPDIVQTWMARACWKTPAWKEHTDQPRYHVVARLGGYYNLKYFQAADFFTTITPDIRAYLVKEGVPANKIAHINNFAETEKSAAPVSRADFATPRDATLLLALGRLHTSKAFDTLIKAVAELPGICLWIAGEGPERKNLEKLIAGLDVGGRVKLLGWRDDRAALLQACDICVFPSRYEPFGTVFVQAWAQKKPVIVSDADGPRQFVRDGEDGLMVPVDDISALRGAIAKLAGDKTLQSALAESGYARYREEFTKEKTLHAYLELYHKLK